jgi:hypothetical protein
MKILHYKKHRAKFNRQYDRVTKQVLEDLAGAPLWERIKNAINIIRGII